MNRFYPGAMRLSAAPPEPGERFVALCGEKVILSAEGALPRASEWEIMPERLRIGRIGETFCSLFLQEETELPEGFSAVDSRHALTVLSEAEQTALARARALRSWRERQRFCGSCGSPTDDDAEECARRCTGCGALHYPKVSPAVIVAVTDVENRLLLAHNRKFRDGMFSLVAGFVEPGESMESAVKRELREEVGIDVDDVRYCGSQSWPFPDSLMAGFTARHAGGKVTPDGEEITEAGFFTPEGMPEIPSPGSISRVLIDAWLENYRKKTL